MGKGDLLERMQREATREAYRVALAASRGNRTAAARLLGVSRQAVHLAINRHPELADVGRSFDPEWDPGTPKGGSRA